MKEINAIDDSEITADKGFRINNVYSIGEQIFRGIYVPIDRVYFNKDNGEKVTAEEWLKGVIKEVMRGEE